MKSSIIIKVKFDGTKLIPASKFDEVNYDMFMKNFKEGDNFTMMVSLENEAKTKPQLAKVHKMIREISEFSGMTFDEVKDLAKKYAGLYDFNGEETVVKSFKECSKKELDAVIKSLEVVAANIGCVFSF